MDKKYSIPDQENIIYFDGLSICYRGRFEAGKGDPFNYCVAPTTLEYSNLVDYIKENTSGYSNEIAVSQDVLDWFPKQLMAEIAQTELNKIRDLSRQSQDKEK